MKVAQLVRSVSRLGGGMFESVRHLSQNVQSSENVDVEVIGLRDEMTTADIAAWAPVSTRIHRVRGPSAFGYAPSVSGGLAAYDPDLVHLHGLWNYLSIAVSKWARRSKRPYIVSPRGMLEPWALRQSPIRKKIALRAFQRATLENAACLHATSEQEAQSVRRLGFHNPIAVIPNGVVLPDSWQKIAGDGRIRQALFLSRLHPKKGLLDLLKAWAEVRPKEWRLLIAGPDEDSHLQEIRDAVARLKLDGEIVFLGDVRGEKKAEAYRSADLFILPSYSENFGLVIAEALSFGIPTITTRATPWQELEAHNCGWWIAPGAERLLEPLRQATSLSIEQLREMGSRGRALIEQKYTWDKVGRQMCDLYRWLVGKGSAPPQLG